MDDSIRSTGGGGEPMLPWDEQAERAVLGAILLDPGALDTALQHLVPEDFHRPAHRHVFDVFRTLVKRGDAIDFVTARAELEARGRLEAAGGAAYLASLIDGLPRVSNVETYARIVVDRAILRRLVGLAEELRDHASQSRRAATEILDETGKKLFDLSERGRRGDFQPIHEIGIEVLGQIDQMSQRRELLTGLGTGYDRIDRMTSGLQAGDLIILAARPSMGKTSLALNIAQNAALQHDAKIGVFSLEMSAPSLFMRLLSGEARLDLQKLRTGSLSRDEWDVLRHTYATLSRASIWIDDTPGIGPMELRAKARRLAHKLETDGGLSLIVIDYLQLMKLETKIESRQQEVSEISRSLKAIAKELKVPVLALSQLSRAPEQGRGRDHRPQLSDLRESGAIEQDADLVMFIYREEFYERDPAVIAEKQLEGKAEVIIAKQRNGPTGTAELFFVKQFTRFENMGEM